MLPPQCGESVVDGLRADEIHDGIILLDDVFQLLHFLFERERRSLERLDDEKRLKEVRAASSRLVLRLEGEQSHRRVLLAQDPSAKGISK